MVRDGARASLGGSNPPQQDARLLLVSRKKILRRSRNGEQIFICSRSALPVGTHHEGGRTGALAGKRLSGAMPIWVARAAPIPSVVCAGPNRTMHSARHAALRARIQSDGGQ